MTPGYFMKKFPAGLNQRMGPCQIHRDAYFPRASFLVFLPEKIGKKNPAFFS
jgi:hypothetical protein